MHYSFKYEGNQTVASKRPRTASYGLKYAIIVKANSFYDSGTSYLFALQLKPWYLSIKIFSVLLCLA